jgi:hypothetical protein
MVMMAYCEQLPSASQSFLCAEGQPQLEFGHSRVGGALKRELQHGRDVRWKSAKIFDG